MKLPYPGVSDYSNPTLTTYSFFVSLRRMRRRETGTSEIGKMIREGLGEGIRVEEGMKRGATDHEERREEE